MTWIHDAIPGFGPAAPRLQQIKTHCLGWLSQNASHSHRGWYEQILAFVMADLGAIPHGMVSEKVDAYTWCASSADNHKFLVTGVEVCWSKLTKPGGPGVPDLGIALQNIDHMMSGEQRPDRKDYVHALLREITDRSRRRAKAHRDGAGLNDAGMAPALDGIERRASDLLRLQPEPVDPAGSTDRRAVGGTAAGRPGGPGGRDAPELSAVQRYELALSYLRSFAGGIAAVKEAERLLR